MSRQYDITLRREIYAEIRRLICNYPECYPLVDKIKQLLDTAVIVPRENVIENMTFEEEPTNILGVDRIVGKLQFYTAYDFEKSRISEEQKSYFKIQMTNTMIEYLEANKK